MWLGSIYAMLMSELLPNFTRFVCDGIILKFTFKMPRIWMDYCDIMVKRRLITETRRVFDRALRYAFKKISSYVL